MQGRLGIYTIERFISYIREYGYEGRATASHCFALSHIPEYWLDDIIAELEDVDLSVVTCYQSTRPKMPMQKLLTEDVVVGAGTDNDRDFVFPHGNADLVEASLVWSLKLHGDWPFVEDYRWFETVEGFWALWKMLTENGAKLLGIEDSYGIEVCNPANLVVFDDPSTLGYRHPHRPPVRHQRRGDSRSRRRTPPRVPNRRRVSSRIVGPDSLVTELDDCRFYPAWRPRASSTRWTCASTSPGMSTLPVQSTVRS